MRTRLYNIGLKDEVQKEQGERGEQDFAVGKHEMVASRAVETFSKILFTKRDKNIQDKEISIFHEKYVHVNLHIIT